MSNQSNTKTSRGIKNVIITFVLIVALVFPLYVYSEDDTEKEIDNQGDIVYKQTAPILKIKRYKKINNKLTWNKVNDSKKYIVYRKAIKKGSKFKKIKTTTKRIFIDNKKYKYGYYYKVRAYKIDATNQVVYSKFSKVKKIKKAYKKSFSVKAFAYHEYNGVCANGQRCKVGRIATDPRVIPTGTWLYVEGYGLSKACDTGGDIKGKVVDLYMNSEGACNRWGIRCPNVYILK